MFLCLKVVHNVDLVSTFFYLPTIRESNNVSAWRNASDVDVAFVQPLPQGTGYLYFYGEPETRSKTVIRAAPSAIKNKPHASCANWLKVSPFGGSN